MRAKKRISAHSAWRFIHQLDLASWWTARGQVYSDPEGPAAALWKYWLTSMGLNSILPSHSCNGGGGERILFLKHLYCYNTKHKRAKANLQENQTTVCTGINLTPHINKPQKLTHIKHQAALHHGTQASIKERSERQKAVSLRWLDHW